MAGRQRCDLFHPLVEQGTVANQDSINALL
jgi:hypothetical protein